MVFRKAIAGVALLSVMASYWLGSQSGGKGEGAEQSGREEGREISVRGEGCDSESGKKLRRGRVPGKRVVDLETLSATHDSNERLAILLELLKQLPSEEYDEIYLSLLSGAEHERRLVLHAMFQQNALASLQFIKDHDPENLEFALNVGLKVDSELVAAWAEAAEVQTLDLMDYEDRQIPDEKIDEWIAASREARIGQEVPDWTEDLPSGKPVMETVEEVVTKSATHPDRGRYWLVHSKDTRARMRAAGDIGWESDDMSWDDFDEWLLNLPIELAEAALAGRLERLAAENPGDAQLLMDFVDRYSQIYQLDQSLYLMAMRLVNQQNGNLALIGHLIARIDAVELKYEAEEVAVSVYGESISASAMLIAIEKESPGRSIEGTYRGDPVLASEWAASKSDSSVRRGRSLGPGELAYLDSLAGDPSMNDLVRQILLSSSASMSRGTPGGSPLVQ